MESPSLHQRDGAHMTVYDVTAPLDDIGSPIASQQLISDYDFGNSYGHPCIVSYSAPNVAFTNVRLTLNITCQGSQYDRLGRIYIGETEIWRMSTAEPNGQDISSGYVKDVTKFLSLFKQSGQKVTFDLGNILDSTYTGTFVASLTADFFNSPSTSSSNGTVADSIIKNTNPPDQITGLAPSLYWTSPDQPMNAQLPMLSRNTTRVAINIAATGNSGEEFWYTHLINPYGNGRNTGNNGPGRFVEVYVDGQLGGIAVPYPVIYAGGFAPSMWAPIVGYRAFDLPFYEVDLSPLLPLFWSQPTNITLKVSNGEQESNSFATDENWFVSASAMTWETEGVIGYGGIVPTTSDNKAYTFVSPSQANLNKNSDIVQVVQNDFDIYLQANLLYAKSSNIESVTVAWSQSAHYANLQNNTNQGNSQYIALISQFTDALTINGNPVLASQQSTSDSLEINLGDDTATNVSTVSIVRAYVESNMNTKTQCFQNGTAESVIQGALEMSSNSSNTISYQQLSLSNGHLYSRDMSADYLNVIADTSSSSNVGGSYASSLTGNQHYLGLADNAISQLNSSGFLEGASTQDYTSIVQQPSNTTLSQSGFKNLALVLG
ncbi:hypothetical protein AWJ20_2433 [Sugiyamaella lignohabitans]|uniref:Peptide N-acetyl-beta-D-glucosaminyl asparaginase amidase A N-terminal domain-containing protein n=1 Tax=Sugiyamaella lignohabitans TaxID=796027 RepID=A0A167F4R4_9ASCO|nr:uncharacterized protein AWJ20_2433 [Sugiyamaella lignohabitans]ANB14821.1 hypothetical protein AWJ20_2433 [Sugiyamaella lignohabitans]